MSDVTSGATAIVTVASWEPRWKESVRVLMAENAGAVLNVIFSSRYADWTDVARQEIGAAAVGLEVRVIETEMDLERPGGAWRSVAELASRLATEGIRHVVLDGTTMPREMTWFLLHASVSMRFQVDYVYVPPGSYGEWLSKESLQPRLVLKRSGVLFPDKPTCVVAMSGFDIGRLNQLVAFFEPARVEIARQTGERYENQGRNNPQLSEYARNAHIFDFDGFDLSGPARDTLVERIAPLVPEFNVLLASLGPKASAVTAFEVTEVLPEVALVYIPSSSYNREYSTGADMAQRITRSMELSQDPSDPDR